MEMIAEAAVAEHTNRNSDYGGASKWRTREEAIKLLSDNSDESETLMIQEHQIRELTNLNNEQAKRITELTHANSALKQKCLYLEVENEQIKKDYCGF